MATLDRFKTTVKRVSDPARFAIAVTGSDSADLPNGVAAALYIGVAGAVAVTLADMDDGTFVTFAAHPVGYFLCQVKRVWATGTTATSVLALY